MRSTAFVGSLGVWGELVFFFSSRRRHTRSYGDWSSDVCSSDLKQTGRVTKTPYLVKKRAVLTGDVLTDARVASGQFQEGYVSVTFDSTGAKLFERITAENVKKRMAIILDNTVYSAAVIQERVGR